MPTDRKPTARRDFTYCRTDNCPNRHGCIRWSGHYDFTADSDPYCGHYSFMDGTHCQESNHYNYHTIEE